MAIQFVKSGKQSLKNIMPKNAGAHNSIYRGEDITNLFYNETLSRQIAAETFDDIFVGDYIIGRTSGRKYLVADLNYRLHTGDTECTIPHVLMIPEKIMGTAQMNTSSTTTGAYVGSAMFTTNLAAHETTIQNDFGTGHILLYRNYLKTTVTNGYESEGEWKDRIIDLMNEHMVFGSDIFHNKINGTNLPMNHEIDNTQLSIFRHRPDLIMAFDDSNSRQRYWLRDVSNQGNFTSVTNSGNASGNVAASYICGVRPAFLIY